MLAICHSLVITTNKSELYIQQLLQYVSSLNKLANVLISIDPEDSVQLSGSLIAMKLVNGGMKPSFKISRKMRIVNQA